MWAWVKSLVEGLIKGTVDAIRTRKPKRVERAREDTDRNDAAADVVARMRERRTGRGSDPSDAGPGGPSATS